jgi:superfamily II DNA/RNA helicase
MRMGKFTGISCACAIPPAQKNYVPISRMPPVTDQVVIGTSGTLIKWITHKKLPTREIKILVFDEADHMLSEVCFESCWCCILTASSMIMPRALTCLTYGALLVCQLEVHMGLDS